MKELLSVLLAVMPMMAFAQYKSQVWSPDNGDGTYTNPVINADYSDPDVCVGPSGEDYYMTASSFQCTPGLPILHSKDLVNWEIVNYALKELYTGNNKLVEHFNIPQHGNGVWAPSIRYHNGEYYIYWGDPGFGVMMVKTKHGDPADESEQPVSVIPGEGYIETTPLSRHTVPMSIRLYWLRAKPLSTALIREPGYIINMVKTGLSIFRIRKPTDVWYT